MQLAEVEQLAKRYVLEEAIIPQPYKICDFRPSYGAMFQDYITRGGYDFWGHCDCDMIFGDIRKFITDEILDKHERVLTRGHLTIYKNSREVNSSYRNVQKPSYKEVYTSAKSFSFDEWAGTSMWWKISKSEKLYDEIVFDDIAPYVYSFYSYQKRKSDKDKKNFMFVFDKGKLYRYYEHNGEVNKEETCYVHFQKRQLSISNKLKNHQTEQFAVIPNKFTNYVGNITLQYLRCNVHIGKIWAYRERFRKKLDELLGRKSNSIYLTLATLDELLNE